MQMTTRSRQIASNVRAEMARAAVTQTRMGQDLRFSQQSISRRLNGHVPFTVDELDVIAEYLGLPLSALIADQQAIA